MFSRRALLAAVPVAGASQLASAATPGGVPNEITVGPGCDFEQVAPALASITDNSKDTPYLISVMPGIYNLRWTAKSWVTVVGSGPMATIFEGADWQRITIAGSNIHLSNFGIRYMGSAANHAAIARLGPAFGVVLQDIHIDHSGDGAALRNGGGGNLQTWWLKGLRIRTEGIGLYIGAHTYCDDLKILLYGDYSGHAHVGCLVVGDLVRIYLNNCRIGTGFWMDYDDGAYIKNEIRGADDVIGVWVPPGSVGARVEIHNLESFCRNENATFPAVNVNVIRAEGGWVRAFGCFGQAETPVDWAASKSLYEAGGGESERFACRFTRMEGQTYGSEVLGVRTFTRADDGHSITKYEGGLHRLDASDGAFTIFLPGPDFADPGVVHVFKKINPEHSITINLSGGFLEGNSSPVVLRFSYDTIKLTWDGNEWVIL